jgi:hypothetical protein
VKFYENQHRQNREVNPKNTQYVANNTNDLDANTSSKIGQKIKEMNARDFHSKFNELFEENMVNNIDTSKNDWFTNEDNHINVDEKVTSGNMGRVLDNVRDKQDAIVKYSGVRVLNSNGCVNNDYYEDDNEDYYVESDPFSKLKFDDLRKVHKDQTIFNVSEKDYNKVQKYSSVDHFVRERGKQSLVPIDKQEAEMLLQRQDKQYREKMMRKEYESTMKTDNYANKNKSILSRFLQIKN